ncbi:hypothetical protein F5Y16DRAFT_423845 [Xylariaceae sp. FL0255]|nr:hypothetical protein F5Y16DRAFT_423845 [Xylariaceae sp. FL0255]
MTTLLVRDAPLITSAQLAVISALVTISIWIVFEFHVQVFRVFKEYRSLYFWSLFILAWGIVLHVLGYLLNWFAHGLPWEVYAFISAVGWSMLVTGESLVLYSRMHLVTRNRKVLRFVLGLIIFSALFVQIPNWVTSIPAVDTNPRIGSVWTPYDAIETRVQLFAFLVQETIISSIYIFYTGKMLKPSLHIRERRVMLDLVYVNLVSIIVDVVAIGFAFSNQNVLKEALQDLSYALKLMLEFYVLNQLTTLAGEGTANEHSMMKSRRYFIRENNTYNIPRTQRSGRLSYQRMDNPTKDTELSPISWVTSHTRSAEAQVTAARYPSHNDDQKPECIHINISGLSRPQPAYTSMSQYDSPL